MKITTKDGREFKGTALQIVRQMKEMSFFGADRTLFEYVELVIEQTRVHEGVDLDVFGGEQTDEEVCVALLDELGRHRLLAVGR